MANLMTFGRPMRCGVAFACALIAFGILTSAPATPSAIVTSQGILHKQTGAALMQHLGSVNPALPRQFTIVLKAGTSAKDAQAVAAYLEHYGLQSIIASSNRFIHVVGTFGAASAAAGVGFERVKLGTETFVRTTGPAHFPPAINRFIAATSINPGMKARALNLRRQALVAGPQLGYGPADYAGIYDINPLYGAGVNGAGSTVDIAACFNIDPADVAYFETFYGLPANVVNVIHVDGTLDQFGNVPPPDIEPTLDVERVIATAPHAKVNLYVVPDCLISQFVDMFAQIASDGGETAMSVSYGLGEADYGLAGIGDLITAQSAALECISDQHVAEFAASGDSGSWGDPFIAVNFLDVLYPASDPSILSVGGTTTEESVIGTRLFEYAWGGSGGGYSGIFAIPPWQAVTPGVASGLFKNLPDISMNADPNTGAAEAFLISVPPPIFPIGGTSASSPTWAGLWALVDQNRRMHGHARLNNPAAALYHLQGSSAYYDITVGANGYFPARKGYDNATGLGVPDVTKLVKALQ